MTMASGLQPTTKLLCLDCPGAYATPTSFQNCRSQNFYCDIAVYLSSRLVEPSIRR